MVKHYKDQNANLSKVSYMKLQLPQCCSTRDTRTKLFPYHNRELSWLSNMPYLAKFKYSCNMMTSQGDLEFSIFRFI